MIKKIYILLFYLGLFFFSFNEYEGLPILGEFRSEAGAIFFFFGFFFLIFEMFHTGKISVPYKNKIFRVIILFLIWCLVATMLNINSVSDNYFKHTTGIVRFAKQYAVLVVSALVFFVYYWNVIYKMTAKEVLFKIRRVFLFSLIVASVYGFVETLVVVFGIRSAAYFLDLFDYFPFLEVSIAGLGRISSIAYEPPFLAIYLITISAWMFSYIITEKKWFKFLPAVAILLLTYFAGSRTGFIIVTIQVIIFVAMFFNNKRFRIHLLYVGIVMTIIISVLIIINRDSIYNSVSQKIESLDFKGNLKTTVSNKSRLGIQFASYQVFKENPIIGVGFGQQAYYNRLYFPLWAVKDNYEFELYYKNKNERSFPPGYNIYMRLLAETGLVGFSILLYLIYFSLKKAKSLLHCGSEEHRILSAIIFISLSGLYINWLQIDTFRLYGIWICLAILIKLSQENLYEK